MKYFRDLFMDNRVERSMFCRKIIQEGKDHSRGWFGLSSKKTYYLFTLFSFAILSVSGFDYSFVF